MLIYIIKLKQFYRLIDIEQQSEENYPVTLRVYYYTKTDVKDNLSEKTLETTLDDLIQSKMIGMVLNHLINLGELKDDDINSLKSQLDDSISNKPTDLGDL